MACRYVKYGLQGEWCHINVLEANEQIHTALALNSRDQHSGVFITTYEISKQMAQQINTITLHTIGATNIFSAKQMMR